MLVIPSIAQAGGRRSGFNNNVAINERGASQSSSARRGGTDDPANHDANDDRGVRRNGADDPAGHNVGDDNNKNRRGRGR